MNDATYQYLPETLNISEMHRMYKEWCHEDDHRPESQKFYNDVFTKRFNLKFKKPTLAPPSKIYLLS